MLTDENIKIDYPKVFSILPEIMGMPMTFYGNRWYAARKIDGSFSVRKDKLVCRLKQGTRPGEGMFIQILEQGGKVTTLFSWMIDYGGCKDKMEAKLRLLNMSAAVLTVPDFTEKYAAQRFVAPEYMERSYEKRITTGDNLTEFLWSIFGRYNTEIVLRDYKLGCSYRICPSNNKYYNMTQFWYINRNQEIYHDKIILYNTDGHRNHDFGGGRAFIKAKGYGGRCFFGEHLLANRNEGEKVYVVESEKTALIAKLYFKKGIWLATGGKCNFRKEGTDKDWIYISDYDAYDYWKRLACQSSCPKWWESYPEYTPGEHDDIGDLILWKMKNK